MASRLWFIKYDTERSLVDHLETTWGPNRDHLGDILGTTWGPNRDHMGKRKAATFERGWSHSTGTIWIQQGRSQRGFSANCEQRRILPGDSCSVLHLDTIGGWQAGAEDLPEGGHCEPRHQDDLPRHPYRSFQLRLQPSSETKRANQSLKLHTHYWHLTLLTHVKISQKRTNSMVQWGENIDIDHVCNSWITICCDFYDGESVENVLFWFTKLNWTCFELILKAQLLGARGSYTL